LSREFSFAALGLLAEKDRKGLLSMARRRRYQERTEGPYSKCHLYMDLRMELPLTGDCLKLSPREFYPHLGCNGWATAPISRKRP
jgi:hypothetical protein